MLGRSGGGKARAAEQAYHLCHGSPHVPRPRPRTEPTFPRPLELQGRWTPEQDAQLLQLVSEKGRKWKEIGASLGRMNVACRDRWLMIRWVQPFMTDSVWCVLLSWGKHQPPGRACLGSKLCCHSRLS